MSHNYLHITIDAIQEQAEEDHRTHKTRRQSKYRSVSKQRTQSRKQARNAKELLQRLSQ